MKGCHQRELETRPDEDDRDARGHHPCDSPSAVVMATGGRAASSDRGAGRSLAQRARWTVLSSVVRVAGLLSFASGRCDSQAKCNENCYDRFREPTLCVSENEDKKGKATRRWRKLHKMECCIICTLHLILLRLCDGRDM
jgi:hypothetical protein